MTSTTSADERGTVRFLMNNDGMHPYAVDVPALEHLHRQVDVLVGTQVDTLCWNVGHTGAWWYDTKVDARWGEGLARLPRARYYRLRNHLETMLARGIDPLQVVLDRGREKGIRVYPGLRVNDCQHGGDIDRLSREHPEFRIGAYPTAGPAAAYEQPVSTYLQQLDLAHAEVRQRLVDVADELLTRYPIAGLELDFLRRPHYFKPDEAVANRHLITDMLAAIRAGARRAEQSRSGPIEIVVRVWPDLDDCWQLGLDVRAWVERGLVDMLMPANNFFMAVDHHIEDFVDVAGDTPVSVVMAYCPLVNQHARGTNPETWAPRTMAGRPVGTVNIDTPFLCTHAMWHGAAHLAFAKGVDGLATFNFKDAVTTRPQDLALLGALASPAQVARHDRLYPYITNESRNKPRPLGAEPIACELFIPDDASAVAEMVLEVYITETTTRDRIAFALNGALLQMDCKPTCPDVTGGLQGQVVDPHHVFECDLRQAGPRRGTNELTVRLVERNPHVGATMVLVGVNVRVRP